MALSPINQISARSQSLGDFRYLVSLPSPSLGGDGGARTSLLIPFGLVRTRGKHLVWYLLSSPSPPPLPPASPRSPFPFCLDWRSGSAGLCGVRLQVLWLRRPTAGRSCQSTRLSPWNHQLTGRGWRRPVGGPEAGHRASRSESRAWESTGAASGGETLIPPERSPRLSRVPAPSQLGMACGLSLQRGKNRASVSVAPFAVTPQRAELFPGAASSLSSGDVRTPALAYPFSKCVSGVCSVPSAQGVTIHWAPK